MQSKITYRQQFTRCGKQRCRKCKEGEGHGPYWYAYWSEKGHTVSKYIGARLPPEVESARQSEEKALEAASSSGASNATLPLLRVYLLGQFRVERKSKHEWKVVDNHIWQRRRARSLLGCLLSSPGRRLGREQIMEQLWPDLDIDIAANRLNGAVHELRQILEPELARPANSRMLRLERDILELADSTHIWVDVEAFENLLKQAHSIDADTYPEQVERLLEESASLYGGNYLLEELYSEWAAHRRDVLQRRWVGLLLDLAQLRAQQGNIIGAIEALDRLHIAEPTNETALQRLMVLLTQLDRRGEALQMYNQHVMMLQREYESEPLPETRALYENLRKGYLPTEQTLQLQVKAREEPTAPTAPKEVSATNHKFSFERPVFQLGRQNRSPLVGRTRERRIMHQAMLSIEALMPAPLLKPNHARHGGSQYTASPPTSSTGPKQPHFLLLTGEPGLGKTRLAEELSIEANNRGWAVIWSRTYEQEGNIPYHSWIELLRMLLQGVSGIPEVLNESSQAEKAQALLHTQLPLNIQFERLSTLLPELSTRSAASLTRSQLPHEQERLHLWEAMLALLSGLSAFHPLLLVLDDLHWTDDSSIELLTYLTHHLRNQRVLLVGTCRDRELSSGHKLRSLISDLRREQAIITLAVQPLTQSQIGTLVSHLPQDIVERIQTQAAGNPFFAEELARYIGTTEQKEETSLLTSKLQHEESSAHIWTSPPTPLQGRPGHDTFPQHSLPEAVAALLERRLSKLSTECQTLLGKAAVLGGSFELSQLQPMAQEHSEDALLDLLEEALQEGLLTEEGTGVHITYHFWHPLIVSHLYERLSAARRAQLHRRAADALRASLVSSPQEKRAAAIFYHLSRGGRDVHDIAFYAELAGNEAHSLSAYFEAQYYYLQAMIAIVDATTSNNITVQIATQRINARLLTQPPLTPDHVLRLCRLLELTAECSFVQGSFEDALALYECILTLRTSPIFQRQVRSPLENRTESQIQALLWREIGRTWIATGTYDRAYECCERGKAVMRQAGVTTGAAWACLHLQFGQIYRYEGNYQEARRYTQEALKILEQVVQQPTFDELHVNQGPRTRTERALLGDPLDLGFAYEQMGIVEASVGQVSDALNHLHTALMTYEQQERLSEVVRVCGNLGAVYIMKGEHSPARTFLRRALDVAERIGDLPNIAFITGNLGDVAHRSGDLTEAEGWFTRSLALAERVNDREHMSWCNVVLADVRQELGQLHEAASNLHRAISIGRAIKNSRCIRFALVSLGDLRIVEALLACALHSTEAKDCQKSIAYQRLLQRAKTTLQRAISQQEVEIETIIDCKLLLATVSFLQEDLANAQQMALQALHEAQEQETTRVIGRAQRLLGRILAAKGQYDAADSYFEQALQIFRAQELRLDYARALHGYGLTLVQRAQAHEAMALLPSANAVSSEDYQRGISYLQEARGIFIASHAAVDLHWTERELMGYEHSMQAVL